MTPQSVSHWCVKNHVTQNSKLTCWKKILRTITSSFVCVCMCVCWDHSGKKREKKREYLRLIEWWIKGVYELQHMDQGVLRAKQNNDSNDHIVFGESRRRTRCTTCSWEMKRMHSLPQSRDPVCRICEKPFNGGGRGKIPNFCLYPWVMTTTFSIKN